MTVLVLVQWSSIAFLKAHATLPLTSPGNFAESVHALSLFLAFVGSGVFLAASVIDIAFGTISDGMVATGMFHLELISRRVAA